MLNSDFFLKPFHLEPQGKPSIVAAHNSSSTSIYLEWSPPSSDTIHGQMQGYLITYRPRDTSPSQAEEVKLNDPGATVFKALIIGDVMITLTF